MAATHSYSPGSYKPGSTGTAQDIEGSDAVSANSEKILKKSLRVVELSEESIGRKY